MRSAVAAACLGVFAATLALRLRSRTRRIWQFTGIASLVVVLVSVGTLPMELRFALSKEAMDDVARAVLDGRRDPDSIDRVGLWHPTRVSRVPGGARISIEGTGFLAPSGFGYQADGLIPPTYRYYKSGWYLWTDFGPRVLRCPRGRTDPRA